MESPVKKNKNLVLSVPGQVTSQKSQKLEA